MVCGRSSGAVAQIRVQRLCCVPKKEEDDSLKNERSLGKQVFGTALVMTFMSPFQWSLLLMR
jgi:hypothetical protein